MSRWAGSRGSDGRVRLLKLLLMLALAVVAGRATVLAATSSDLSSIAVKQQQREVALPAHRGAILDHSGQELAVGRERQTVFATPYLIKDAEKAARRLAAALKLKVGPVRKALTADPDAGFVYVTRKAEPALAEKAVALGIPGVGSYPEELRFYPLRRVAAQVIGYAGAENTGLAGLELLYDDVLRGRAGSAKVVCDPSGRVLETQQLREPQDGVDVRLTLDADIQFAAEQELARTLRKFTAQAATAVVMDPRDGSILAMANVPLVNANTYGKDAGHTRNRAVTDVFEPGSIFKVVTVAAAIQEGLVSPETSFVLPPSIRVGDRVIHEAHPRGTETFSVRRILVESSNVGAATLGQKIGQERFISWLGKFGFGTPTGVEFPGEVGGIVPDYWSASTIGNVPMGQGISTTALQMAAAYSAIANDGVLLQPRLVAQVGTEVARPDEGRRVLSPSTARKVLDMMEDVVSQGTGTGARIQGYRVGGKTGTAQKADTVNGGYAKGRYIASFVLTVPVDDPQLVVLVTVDEPQPYWGGTVAAPAARAIAEFALQKLKIAP